MVWLLKGSTNGECMSIGINNLGGVWLSFSLYFGAMMAHRDGLQRAVQLHAML